MIVSILSFQSTCTLELTLHLENKVIWLKQDALRLMNIVLVGTACGQIFTLFKFAFAYPESKESKECGKQLEELEHHFDTNNKLPGEEDTVSKRQDEQDATAQFTDADIEPKSRKWRFGYCQDDLKDLVLINKATPILPSTTVKLSKIGVPQNSYSDQSKSEGQSIYQCLLMKPGTEILCTYYAAQMAAMCTHIQCKHIQICIKCRLCAKKCYSSMGSEG